MARRIPISLLAQLIESSSSDRSNRRNYKSIKDIITGKDGRIRGQLCGKRCDFSARGVASGDNFLKPYEVGLPLSICRKLTIPIKVTDFNRKNLEEQKENNSDSNIDEEEEDEFDEFEEE